VRALWAFDLRGVTLRGGSYPFTEVQALEDVGNLDSRSDREWLSLTTQLQSLRQERYRWADKAMSGAVPEDIAQEKQASLSKQISHAQARLAALQIAATDIQAMRPVSS